MINNIIDIFIFINIVNFIIIIIELNNFVYDKEIIDIRIILVIFNIYIEIHVIYDITQDIQMRVTINAHVTQLIY